MLPDRDIRTDEPLLILGDLPLRLNCRQTLFIQTPHLVSSASVSRWTDRLRFAVARAVLRHNLRRVGGVIVQTPAMRQAISTAYPMISSHIHVVAQPPPQWLASARGSRNRPVHDVSEGLRLAYPAAGYPHKNHALLGGISTDDASRWPVASLALTLDAAKNPASRIPWVRPIGHLEPAGMIHLYRNIDALLFLSLEESYGFPLVEAMCVGLPIVCADRPYARVLCGDIAIYFDPWSVDSLRGALEELHSRLCAGWWPNWSRIVTHLPTDWQSVADRFLEITIGSGTMKCVSPESDARE
jgi:glycosyltransferase involved in cell wall biosynthesis